MPAVLKWIFTSGTGRLILVGLLVVGAVAAAKFYYVELPEIEKSQETKSGEATIEGLADAFADHLSNITEGDRAKLPKRSQWYPATLPCASKVPYGPTTEPIWAALKLDPAEDTSYQLRFDLDDGKLTFWARRDSDCDGLYAVFRMEASTDWQTLGGREIIRENRNE